MAYWFVVVGVSLETLFSIMLFASEERIASLQRGTITVQNGKIIALEEPRDINLKVFDSLLANAAKTPFVIQYTGGGDTEWLAERLEAAFVMLHWPTIETSPSPVVLDNTELCRLEPDVGCISAETMGVTVLMHAPPSATDNLIEEEIMAAFANAQIGWLPDGAYGGSDESVPANTVRIIVAPRP